MKLPDINYGRVGALPQENPAVEVQSFRQKQSLFDAAYKVGMDVAEEFSEESAIKANAQVRDAVNGYNEFVAANPTATMDELKAYADANGMKGVFDDVNTTAFDERGEVDLPAHLWSAQGLDKISELAIEESSQQIWSPRYRKAWVDSVKESRDKMVTTAVQNTAKSAVSYEIDRHKSETLAAIDNNNFTYAEELLTANNVWSDDRSTQKILKREVFIGKKENEIETALLSASTLADFDEILDTVTSPEWSSGLSAEKKLSLASGVVVQRNAAIKRQKELKTETENNAYANAVAGIVTGEVGLNEILGAKDILGGNFKATIGFYQSHVKSGGIDDPNTSGSLDFRIRQLQIGATPLGTSLSKNKMALMSEIQEASKATLDGSPPLLTSGTASTMIDKIQKVASHPYSGWQEYKHLQKQLSLRILGADSGGILQFNASDETRAMLANAQDSLFKFVNENGGLEADLAHWQKDVMPTFLESAAKASLMGLPSGIKDYVVYSTDGGFKVNDAETQDNLARKVNEARAAIDAGERNGESKLRLANEQMNEYNRWRTTVGVPYVN